MIVAPTIADMRGLREAMTGRVGLVPTMGYLHEGHLSLVRQARQDSDHVVVSIFVNPTQFAPSEDLSRYPRDLDRDLALLAQEGVDVVYAPEADEVYPPGFDTFIDVGGVSRPLEGEHRPGHFRGVATVVAKLLNVVQPHQSYFGQKDAQQLAVIRALVRDLDMPVRVIGMPTVREPDGLAMSSRNVYLSPVERTAALVLYRALCLAHDLIKEGNRDAETIRVRMRELIESEPLARIDYVSIANTTNLQELSTIKGDALVSLAVRIGATRLIDNMSVAAR